MVNLFKKYKVVILILFLLLFILSLLVLISFKESNTNQNPRVKSDFKGYDVIVQSFDELDKDTSIPKNARYQRLKEKIMSLEDPKLSKKQKYDNLTSAENNLFDTYLMTKNNKVYTFNTKLNDFSKTNFPEYYKEGDFGLLVCYDSSCADSPQPQEILDIIDEINSSSLPDEAKKLDSEILIVYTFATKDHNQTIAKVNNYYFLAQSIKRSSEYEKAGINIKISDEIMNYLNKNYPKELSEVIGGQ